MDFLCFYRFGHVYHNLQPRVTRTLLHTFLDPIKVLPQHYGAIQGLAALGPSVVIFLNSFLFPTLLKCEKTRNFSQLCTGLSTYTTKSRALYATSSIRNATREAKERDEEA